MRTIGALLLGLVLAACAGGQAPRPEPAAPPPRTQAGDVALAVVGTPFLLAFKTTICAASVVVAGPAAGIVALDPATRREGLAVLGDGLARNCGPPYVVSPAG